MKALLSVVFMLLSSSVMAHPYKLDSYGCHNNGALNIYECHSGELDGKSWPNPGGQALMLKEASTPKLTRQTSGVLVSWLPIEGASYQLAFYSKDSRDEVLPQVEIDRRSYIIDTEHYVVFVSCILPGTEHWFRVRSVVNGQVSPWSETVYFKGE